MKRSIENLMISLEEEELRGMVEQKLIDHNKSVLEAILQGRSYFMEKIVMAGGSSPGSAKSRSVELRVSKRSDYSAGELKK